MEVLIVCSGNSNGNDFDFQRDQVFIFEQVESLKSFNVRFSYFFIKGKGLIGYLKNFSRLKKELNNNYDIIHAHNGLCGLISNLQRKVPVITTYHGSDINIFRLRLISYFSLLTSAKNILVSNNQLKRLWLSTNTIIIPCGVDTRIFSSTAAMPCKSETRIILFGSSFTNRIKNYPLAKTSVELLRNQSIELVEIRNKSREQVRDLLNNCELLLLTSLSEGSPQIIKEALACNCPIVSTDVGDVRELISDIEGCYISSFNPEDISSKIEAALDFARKHGRTKGFERIDENGLDLKSISSRILKIYEEVISRRN